MKAPELAPRYDSSEVESKWYEHWEKSGYFRPASDTKGKSQSDKTYVIVIPPPNVTGILHMGHALNNTIQDIMIRWNRMRGLDTLWVPGVDHAGIATQNVVERKLAKEKKTRDDLGRAAFLEEVWKWKEEHGNTITRQLRRLGASCDWTRERFTMDDGLSKAVRECFVKLYEDGLIYQGHYIINWCPRCQTALSDEESEHQDVTGGFYHLKYPIKGAGDKAETFGEDHIIVATTRPETMLGDAAVAVNPNDERYKNLIGKTLILPLVNREIPVIADEFVDSEFGTGMVKVTPAHDPNDFEMGKRHNLPEINVMHPDGKINEEGGPYSGLDRFVARKKVIEDLEAQGLFIKKEKHKHSVGHCYRCNTVVEPYLSKQWFVKMKPLADKALEAHARGETTFYPDRWTKVYTNWLEGMRDWCISRQIWWGHQIPVWYCDGCLGAEDRSLKSEDGKKKGIICSRENPEKCPDCGNTELRQDEDVLDTWFSSWLWPFSTLGWPEDTEDLKHFYPTSDLITAPEIIFFWVARMIMSGLYFKDEVPFNRIHLHGTVRAEGGLKMSKSLGNSIDPLEIIEEMGADALRFSMTMLSAQDVYISREKFEMGRNFNNKIWNASRFIFMNLEGLDSATFNAKPNLSSLPISSRWILARLDRVIGEMDKNMNRFGLAQASSEIYHFIWNDLCDWFIEMAKPALADGTPEEKKSVQTILFYVLERSLRLLHPFSPFITEEIWQKLKSMATDQDAWPESIMVAPWPTEEGFRDENGAEDLFKNLQDSVKGFREMRARLNLDPSLALDGIIDVPESEEKEVFSGFKNVIERLGRIKLEIKSDFKADKSYLGNAYSKFKLFIKIAGVVDPAEERTRTEKKIQEKTKWIKSLQGKLSNEKFVSNAPAEVIEKEKEKLDTAEKELKSHQEYLRLFD